MQKYNDWINKQTNIDGRCYEISCNMVKEFPELYIVIGEVLTNYGWENHTWCCNEDGFIIDPTEKQFDVIYKYITKHSKHVV